MLVCGECSLLSVVYNTHTHTVSHKLLMDCSLTLSPLSPSVAHSASSASGRVAFILPIILSSTSSQSVTCFSFLLETERQRVEQNPPFFLLAAMTRHNYLSVNSTFISQKSDEIRVSMKAVVRRNVYKFGGAASTH